MASADKGGGNLFIVDNSDETWKVSRYLHDWCDIAESIDIATGYFEIGALLALDGQWQKLDKIRILLGDQVTKRTRAVLLVWLEQRAREAMDDSLEGEKLHNDFLTGVAAIEEAMRTGKIECRVYAQRKFHAKAYITHARLDVVGSAALVGSSNFTAPGLTQNVELNIQVKSGVEQLQLWFDEYWEQADGVTAELLQVIERHTREYSPFEVYAKSLQEYFKGHELTAGEWELTESKMYPVLAQYQKEGYQALMKIGGTYDGAFLCDGVGLGKTFIGLMLIERLVMFEHKRVALFVPKAAREPVWESKLKKYLPHLLGDFSSLVVFNHTDLSRGGVWSARMERVAEMADVVIMDEAHHFRNTGTKGTGEREQSRYWKLFEITKGKKVFMLTATPVNNRLLDLKHMIDLFAHERADYFAGAPLGIHSLQGHFRKLEKELERGLALPSGAEPTLGDTNLVEADAVLLDDELFKAIVVQRSRDYVKKSVRQEGGGEVPFPDREVPHVADYSIERTYGRLLEMLEKAFSKQKPLFSLAMYYPLFYYCGPDTTIDAFQENRQKQVVGLIRIQFLKRFESSVFSFSSSCQSLLLKLLSFAEAQAGAEGRQRDRLEKWKLRHDDILRDVWQAQAALEGIDPVEADDDDDFALDDLLSFVPSLSPEDFKLDEIMDDTLDDLSQVADFLRELRTYDEGCDDKFATLLELLTSDAVLSTQKCIIFTEFMTTARYLQRRLVAAGIEGVAELDSAYKRDRGEVIQRFSPYYNDTTSGKLVEEGKDEIRVIVSTDVLSEGLNLQDATRLINYDLHWNPVRLMQRIGRVDRRLDPVVESQIVEDHPDAATIRGTVAYWNFLPPAEMNRILSLYNNVSKKTLRISKVFGIEGKKLLGPDDDYDALKDFNHSYEGSASFLEKLHLEYQALLAQYPDLASQLRGLPRRVFSGKAHPSEGAKGVFFCFALPAPSGEDPETANVWTDEAGSTAWYLYDLESGSISVEPNAIANLIRSAPATPRRHVAVESELSDIRAAVERYITNTYLKKVQAPYGVSPTLVAWMELS